MARVPNGRRYVCYSLPGPDDRMGDDFDNEGHLSGSVLETAGVSPDAVVYLCGPNRFMADMKDALSALGVAHDRIFVELFTGRESMTPGVVKTRVSSSAGARRRRRRVVSFARSGIAAHRNASAHGLLEPPKRDVPVAGRAALACATTASGLVSGDVAHDPEPLTPQWPATRRSLLATDCDVVIDLESRHPDECGVGAVNGVNRRETPDGCLPACRSRNE
jgi:hypothetical protein